MMKKENSRILRTYLDPSAFIKFCEAWSLFVHKAIFENTATRRLKFTNHRLGVPNEFLPHPGPKQGKNCLSGRMTSLRGQLSFSKLIISHQPGFPSKKGWLPFWVCHAWEKVTISWPNPFGTSLGWLHMWGTLIKNHLPASMVGKHPKYFSFTKHVESSLVPNKTWQKHQK